jgi:hypothetical protein
LKETGYRIGREIKHDKGSAVVKGDVSYVYCFVGMQMVRKQ